MLEAPKRHEGRAIADAAATMGTDLIVMGNRGRSRLAGIMLRSVTASVITMLPAPSLWPVSADFHAANWPPVQASS
jgi:Universal stress protein family